MRILFATPYYYPELKFGGPPKRVHSLSQGLIHRGHDVRVVTTHSEKSRAQYEQRFDGVPVQYIPWRGKSGRQLPVRVAELKTMVKAADIIHCYGLYNLLCPLTALLAIRYAKPYLLEPMGMFVPRVASVRWKRLYHATFTGWMARKAAAAVATSPLELQELTALGHRVNLVLRRNGVDIQAFAKLPPKQIMRERWNALPDERIVLYLGRINEKKNLEELIAAFRKAKMKNALLMIAGPCCESKYFERLRRLTDSTEAMPRIQLEGPLYEEDHRGALAAADLFVLPSLNENFGNAAAEAVAAGVPVLLTNTCGIAPLIDRRAGLAVPLGVDSLAEGLKVMLDPAQRDILTAQREQVKRELSWDEPIRQTEELYLSIIERSKAESKTPQ
jgi:glycosyltransferase involved in cell wall biosynthesis